MASQFWASWWKYDGKWENLHLFPDFETQSFSHLWRYFYFLNRFGKISKSCLRKRKWYEHVKVFGFTILNFVVNMWRKMRKSLLLPGFEPQSFSHLWRYFYFLCRFEKILKSCSREFHLQDHLIKYCYDFMPFAISITWNMHIANCKCKLHKLPPCNFVVSLVHIIQNYIMKTSTNFQPFLWPKTTIRLSYFWSSYDFSGHLGFLPAKLCPECLMQGNSAGWF